ncbi:MAG: DUF3325 domain-containing protein [Kiloniellaceae bacterium]
MSPCGAGARGGGRGSTLNPQPVRPQSRPLVRAGNVGHFAAFAFAAFGMALLCLAMRRHQEELNGRRLGRGAGLLIRAGGFTGLAVSYGCAVGGFGYGVGTTAWFGHLTMAAILVVCCLALRRPHRASGSPRRASRRKPT